MPPPPPPPPPPDPEVLMDDLVEEFLLRLPPEDPAVLARAALVSRQWHRVVTGADFRRRFREFHRSPPLLGYIANIHGSIRFVPMSSFRPRYAGRRGVRVAAIHSSHGRVLLRLRAGERRRRRAGEDPAVFLSVWDPITGEQRDLPMVPLPPASADVMGFNWGAGDGCNHIRCHFKVVFVGRSEGRNFSCLYSSEVGSWSAPIFASGGGRVAYFITRKSVHVGSALYFMSQANLEIFKYDLLTNQMSTICLLREEHIAGICRSRGARMHDMGTMLFAAEDGRLGVAKTSDSALHLWVREDGRWEQTRVIELGTLLPPEASLEKPWVPGFAETGAGVIIFLKTCVGYFVVDPNTGRSNNVGDCVGRGCIIPYVSFCSPAPGAVFEHERPGAVVVSTDEGSGAGVPVSMDEVPDVAVAISTD